MVIDSFAILPALTDAEFKVLLAALSLSGGILGASLKSLWDRRAEKKRPKTEARAKAYEDFVTFCLTGRTESIDAKQDELAAIKARLVVYGESEVVEAVAAYLRDRDLSQPFSQSDLRDLRPVIRAMRASIVTGRGPAVMKSIEDLLVGT